VLASRHRHGAPIGLLCVAPFMVVLDSNLIAIALPSIRDDLGFSRGGLQWVVTAYSLAFGGGLLVAGRVADLHGRRRLLVLGLALFSAASLAAALAPSIAPLLAARALQGLGAAIAFPASLALIAALSAPGAERNRALGLYGAAASAAFVSGMVVGGVLTGAVGWRPTLLAGCPIGAGAALATRRLVPESRLATGGARLGLPGALAASGAVFALLYGLAASAVLALAPCALLLGAACLIERRSRAPLVPGGLLRRRAVLGAVLAALVTVGTGVGVMFVLTLYLQDVLGHGPFATGLALSLLGIAGVSSGLVAPRVAERIGLVRTLAGALAIQAAGVASLTGIGAEGGTGPVLIGTAVLGLGHFAATVAFTSLATAGDADADHGSAMGLIASAQQIGGAVGLALLVAIAGARTASVAGHAGAQEAVVEGFRWALASGAGLSLVTAGLVLAITGRAGPARRPVRGSRTTRVHGRSSRR
jgi:MFS family permease